MAQEKQLQDLKDIQLYVIFRNRLTGVCIAPSENIAQKCEAFSDVARVVLERGDELRQHCVVSIENKEQSFFQSARMLPGNLDAWKHIYQERRAGEERLRYQPPA